MVCKKSLVDWRPCGDYRRLNTWFNFSEKQDILIVGDFNAPGVDWQTWTAQGLPDNFNHKLLQWTTDKLLCQIFTFGTWAREGQQSNCLDLIFTLEEESVIDLQDRPH
ncbi:unnamed protein product [Dibothriocephalus latus]|uniref:Endonuclease/exonuclease/phosphatase domain-containing protein n=1 Tax=Dibothriocephalus latus TaxID=60516 RepID=A0A3P7P0W7_DIBLA|nr:unnamed protein product [Dibothriocephalus latus]